MTFPKNVLVLGARGMLGQAVVRELAARTRVLPADLEELDLTRRDDVIAFINDARPAAVVNCAAYTQVDAAESEPEAAFAVNTDGAGFVAEACSQIDAPLIHISTDYVFDGRKPGPYTEDDPPSPLGVYGRTKAEGDRRVLAAGEHSIIRTAWLYGPGGGNFVDTIRRRSKEQAELRVVNDQVGSPTYTLDLAGAIARWMESGERGLVHFTNAGSCTWCELASRIVALTGSNARVVPISTSELDRPAPRPIYSVLDTTRYQRIGGQPRPWEDALADYLNPQSAIRNPQ